MPLLNVFAMVTCVIYLALSCYVRNKKRIVFGAILFALNTIAVLWFL